MAQALAMPMFTSGRFGLSQVLKRRACGGNLRDPG
jgi:hypothetical protein